MMKRLISIFSAVLADLFIIPAVFPAEKPASQESITRPNIEYKAEGLRDPFQSPLVEAKTPAITETSGAAESVPPSLTVQGLVWGGNFPQAIVNNKVVRTGDTIDGTRIISIDKDGVTVLFGERQYKLPAPAASAGPSKKP
jgi:hypothetical protein